ncbi:hypothetical protein I302_103988 [Kwoniella bestiolae CBS 10118]|uniref:N(6)-L-threonylcarbamoyladenine synthase n=1 Tax=Kwoniella bestiolae CBS 10118 TaxID=1296100 RepID=A0A1B9G9X8_9TREE|nr:hypothetical protein I302_02693 [Kwoniella bestiolae CBS 10118]OCF27844.1 hypothetical protein I302_02693 [Kwoniella bestiolae CBS 10118]
MKFPLRPTTSSFRALPPRSITAYRPLIISPSTKPLTVLGIESSADDSSASIVTSNRQILSLVTISQHSENSLYGGIHPLVAQSSHNKNIPIAIERCIKQSGISISDVDAIAYTRGPGMRGCLSIGEMAAKGLAAGTGKRLVGVHHMQAHALTPLLTEPSPPKCPFLILLVSGGHTQLVLAEEQDRFKILLDTLDSKIGDVFEKAARLIQLPHSPTKSPGATLEHHASLAPLPPYDSTPLDPLPIPLSTNDTVNKRAFSFAGILSSLQRRIGNTELGEGEKREYSRVFQEAAVGHLVFKLRQTISSLSKDAQTGKNIGGLVISGGVASNLYLRQRLEEMLDEIHRGKAEGEEKMKLYYPPIALCTDNAAMIAWTAILRIQSDPSFISDPYDLPLRPKWSLEDLYDDVGCETKIQEQILSQT